LLGDWEDQSCRGEPGPQRADGDAEVECDWFLLSTCNFRCAYCFVPHAALGRKIAIHASPQRWSGAFDATGRRWLIHITGGEPTVYPHFLELCAALTRQHRLSFNSNLSQTCVRGLAGRVDPARVSFINAGLHLDERHRRDGLAAFIANARHLLDAGFPVLPTVVATPEVLDVLPDVIARLAGEGLWLLPKLLRGPYQGRNYPAAYSDDERAVLQYLVAEGRANYPVLINGDERDRPSIDVSCDDALLDAWPSFHGRPCSAGHRFVRMDADGSVYRCSSKQPLGNLLDGTLRLTAGPAPCDTSYCVYFCRKYTSAAFTGAAAPTAPAAGYC
jgi:MoaA/NifB/PqqE/SkfB family radical SAM enzyme